MGNYPVTVKSDGPHPPQVPASGGCVQGDTVTFTNDTGSPVTLDFVASSKPPLYPFAGGPPYTVPVAGAMFTIGQQPATETIYHYTPSSSRGLSAGGSADGSGIIIVDGSGPLKRRGARKSGTAKKRAATKSTSKAGKKSRGKAKKSSSKGKAKKSSPKRKKK